MMNDGMVSTHADDESPLSQYVRMFCELHMLTESDLGETENADRLRDETDLPWRRLTAEDHGILDKLAIEMSRLGVGGHEPTTTTNMLQQNHGNTADFVESVRLMCELHNLT